MIKYFSFTYGEWVECDYFDAIQKFSHNTYIKCVLGNKTKRYCLGIPFRNSLNLSRKQIDNGIWYYLKYNPDRPEKQKI